VTDIFDVMNRIEDIVEEEEEFKLKPLYSPFDFINSINEHKDLLSNAEDPEAVEKDYAPWIINRGLSFFSDTVNIVNFVNINHHLDKKLQYAFLINTIRPKKRFSKWFKKEKDSCLDLVKEAFGYSDKKAEAALSILSPSQIKEIKRRLSKGGLKNEVISR
jgi:Bacteriophage clamp loader A subunit